MHGSADDVGDASEPPLPQTVANDDHGIAPGNAILLGAEDMPDFRGEAELVEVIPRYEVGENALGVPSFWSSVELVQCRG